MRSSRALISILAIGLLLGLTSLHARAAISSSAPAAPQTGLTLALSNPYCVQVSHQSGTCAINFRYMNAATTDVSFDHIQIAINGKVRFFMSGFFENSANMTGRMLGGGLKVGCGLPNASGVPNYGHIYSVVVTAAQFGGSPLVDTAAVACPAFQSNLYLPVARK